MPYAVSIIQGRFFSLFCLVGWQVLQIYSEVFGFGARKTFASKFCRTPGITRSDGVCQDQHNKIRLAGVLASEIRLFKTFDKISKRGPFCQEAPSGWRPPFSFATPGKSPWRRPWLGGNFGGFANKFRATCKEKYTWKYEWGEWILG